MHHQARGQRLVKRSPLQSVLRRARAEFLPLLLLLGVCLILGGEAVAQSAAKKTAPRSQASQDKPAIPDPIVIDKQGFHQLLEKHRGKPLLVNFWATWCEPCRDEFPMLNELARTYAPQGLVVLAVSLDDDTDINLVRHFLAKINPVLPSFRKKPGNDEEFINSVHTAWSGALPATFFYDREGRLVANLVGEHKRPEFERIIQPLVRAGRPKGPAASNHAPEKGNDSCCSPAETKLPGSDTAPSKSPRPLEK